jgi:hypothetical protein
VGSQVNTTIDPISLKLSIGLVSVFSRPVWSWFLGLLGNIVWTVGAGLASSELSPRVANALSLTVPRLIFIDEGIRLRPNSPVWKARTVALVVAVENWRGKPPPEWWVCETHKFDHQELGGVTNGKFKVYVAKSLDLMLASGQAYEWGCRQNSNTCWITRSRERGARSPTPRLLRSGKTPMVCYIGTDDIIRLKLLLCIQLFGGFADGCLRKNFVLCWTCPENF